MGCDGGDIEPQPLGLYVEAPGGGGGQKRALESRVWEGDAGTWPEPSPHTASDCGRLTAHPDIGPLACLTPLASFRVAKINRSKSAWTQISA